MDTIIIFLNWAALTVTLLFFIVLCISSFIEKEYRAGFIALIACILNTLFWIYFLLASSSFQIINIIVVLLLCLFTLISMVKFFPQKNILERDISKAGQYDERDTMFARNNIKYHPELMEQYYLMHPENRSRDRQIHQKPEFGDREQIFHDPHTVPCFKAAFKYLQDSIPLSDGKTAEPKINIDPVQFSQTIGELGKFYGACDIGFLKLAPHHFYSHRGRHKKNWGEKTDQTYQTAIAIVVPMRINMVKKGPTSCMLQESAQKYVEAAKISNIIAGYIRQFGYRARAHNDGNYDVLCVPIAVESGLGELGRMGIFMHKIHGPCVRIAVVTTDIVLPDSLPKKPFYDCSSGSMEEFCKICKKCADNCPSNSITHDDEPLSRNFRHWSIQQEQCYSYWKTIGSDCGICIAVCPYTKPDTLIHRFVRFYISRNPLNQKIALFMDDLLYGRYKKIADTNPEKILPSR
ncbi:MAG: 4Fe-4S dicluster domain-containing protein [Desulfobacula sp.]|nr:4Fe-4S dicluster domain-containing protein [Desulfobacula sp.]